MTTRMLSFILAFCMVILCAPVVSAESVSSDTEQGFKNVEQDGGMLFVGTARIPNENSDSVAAVKYIYSDGIVLNEKSLELIQNELKYFGINISQDDTTSVNSSLPQKRQALFACGSESAPTELKLHEPQDSVEKSFESLFKGYLFSISGYASLKTVFEDRDEIKISEDGRTAQRFVVMEENYTEKIINGKSVIILMINSELKYSFQAPKITFVKDENYVASASDVTSSETGSTTYPVSQVMSETAVTVSFAPKITAGASPEITVASRDTSFSMIQTTLPSAAVTSSIDSPSTQITAGALPEISAASQMTTNSSPSESLAPVTSPSLSLDKPTIYENHENSTAYVNNILGRTTENSRSSQRAVVNTKRKPLNIRSGPGKNYMVVTVLPKGTYVTVLDTGEPNWYMIKTGSRVVGYAYSKYIRTM